MRRLLMTVICAFGLSAGSAAAEFTKIDDAETFRSVISGKTLSRPFIRLQVSPGGTISGKGLSWPVTGNWTWQDGFFCRDLTWGDSELGYNCQEVRLNGGKIRFRSDRGTGDFADFSLN